MHGFPLATVERSVDCSPFQNGWNGSTDISTAEAIKGSAVTEVGLGLRVTMTDGVTSMINSMMNRCLCIIVAC